MKRPWPALVAIAALLAAAPAAHAFDVVTIAEGGNPDLSADGSALVFESSRDLDPRDEDGDSLGGNDSGGTFITTPGSGAFARVATFVPRANGTSQIIQANGPSISDSGRIVGLYAGGDFTGGDGPAGIFTAELATGGRARLDSRFAGVPEIAVSGDGSAVVWDLVFGNGPTATYKSYWAPAAGGAPQLVSDGALDPQVSGDGRVVVFTRMRTPTFSQNPKDYEVWVKDMRTGALEQISRNGKDQPASGFGGSISGDGRYVAFRSIEELTPGSSRYLPVYVYDRQEDTVAFVATTPKDAFPGGPGRLQGAPSPYMGYGTRISNNGRSIAFKTYAPLAPEDSDQLEDLYVKNRDTEEVVRVPLSGAELIRNWFALSGDGSALTWAPVPSAGGEATVFFARLHPAGQECPIPTPHPERKLTRLERGLVIDSKRRPAAQIERARKALATDSRRHPRNRGRNRRLLRELNAYARAYPPHAVASESEGEALVTEAKCSLLQAAEDSLNDSLERYGHAQKKNLLVTLATLRTVLKGEADEEQKRELLKEHVHALFDQLGGDGAAKKYAGLALDAYDLLKAQLDGTLTVEKRKKLKAALVKIAKKVSQRYFGDDAPELVDQVLILREVIAGDRDPERLNTVLKDSVALLVKKLLVNRAMSLPQLRAAMLGFELGRPFGQRLAADLDLIANKSLVRACAAALARKQSGSSTGVPDYGVPTVAVIAGDQWYAGWTCTIMAESIFPGYGGLVQAQKPGDQNVVWSALWRITAAKPVVIFDPRFSV